VLVCHCMAVNDETIRNTIAAGARDAHDVAEMCGAGSRCGGCVPAILELLREAAAEERRDVQAPAA